MAPQVTKMTDCLLQESNPLKAGRKKISITHMPPHAFLHPQRTDIQELLGHMSGTCDVIGDFILFVFHDAFYIFPESSSVCLGLLLQLIKLFRHRSSVGFSAFSPKK